MQRRFDSWWALGGLSLSLAACDATLGGVTGGAELAPVPGETGAPGGTGALGAGCRTPEGPGAVPLRRLTQPEYRAAVRALLSVELPAGSALPPDEVTAGFRANWVSAVGETEVGDLAATAEAVAELALAADENRLRVCDGGIVGAACVEQRLSELTRSAYRRAPLPEELAALLAFHADSEAEFGPRDADRMFLELLLQTPQFLYLSPPFAGTELTSVASRLAFFLTGAPPDPALLELALGGTLLDPGVLEAEVERLLASAEFEAALQTFVFEWFDVERTEVASKDPALFPDFDDALRGELVEEMRRFVGLWKEQGARVETLFTLRDSFVGPRLAALYGVSDQHSGDGFQRVTLPESERSGILTQAGFLAGHAHPSQTSWVLRGEFVRRNLLCDELPPPPGEVDLSVANDGGRLDDPVCRGCHLLMDPIGKSFDGYDAIGRYLGTGGTTPNESGELFEGSIPLDVAGPFSSPIELSQRLAASRTVEACVSRQLFRFATRRLDTEEEACALEAAALEGGAEGTTFLRLIQHIATSEAFLGTPR